MVAAEEDGVADAAEEEDPAVVCVLAGEGVPKKKKPCAGVEEAGDAPAAGSALVM